jgi:hypothetical protein
VKGSWRKLCDKWFLSSDSAWKVNEMGEMSVKFVMGNLRGIRFEEDLGVRGVPLQFGLCIFCILQIYFLSFSYIIGLTFLLLVTGYSYKACKQYR